MRSYHCNDCNACVLRRDQHCAWLLNCIGYGNYKSFYFFLMYLWTTALFVCWSYRKMIYMPIVNKNYPRCLCALNLIMFITCLALGVLLLYYNIFHTWLILKAYTTTEYYEIYKQDKNKPRSIYSISFTENLKIIFGCTLKDWILPFSTHFIRY